MKNVFLLLLLICTLTAQAQTYWNGTADKNFPGDGTEASPYLISTPEQLAGLAERTNVDKEDFAGKYVKLTADIWLTDFSNPDTANWKEWEPIAHTLYKWGEATDYGYFRGHFDGDGHTIYNMYYGKGMNWAEDWDPNDFDIDLGSYDFSVQYKALFCNLDGGTIENLNLANAKMSGVVQALLVLNVEEGSVVRNCHVQGELRATQESSSGLVNTNKGLIENCSADVKSDLQGCAAFVGFNEPSGIIRNCTSKGAIRCTMNAGAGFVSSNTGLIEKCTSNVYVQALGGPDAQVNAVGGHTFRYRSGAGFVLENSGIIRECAALGKLAAEGTSSNHVWGSAITGFAYRNWNGRIESSYCTGELKDVSDSTGVGGDPVIATFCYNNGEDAIHSSDDNYRGDIFNCYTTSTIRHHDPNYYRESIHAFLGKYHGNDGFTEMGYVSPSLQLGCYFANEGLPQIAEKSGAVWHGIGKPLQEMQSQAFVDTLNMLASFLGTSQWELKEGLPRPTGVYEKNTAILLAGGDGTKESPYLIATKAQLKNMAWLVNQGATFKGQYILQTEDIELNAPFEKWGEEMPEEWAPIGSPRSHPFYSSVITNEFRGNYNGGFHEVKNMYIDNLRDYQGFFGIVGDSTCIRNLGVTDCYMRAGNHFGILAGQVGLQSKTIQCWTSGDAQTQGVYGGGCGGALFGDMNLHNGHGAWVLNCSSTAHIQAGNSYREYLFTAAVYPGFNTWAEDSLVNYLFAGTLGDGTYGVVPSEFFQYPLNPFIDKDLNPVANMINVQYSKTTAWLQSKECVNTYNDAVSSWNAAHADDDEMQLNYWLWREGQYPVVSPDAAYIPSVAITFESNGGTAVSTRYVELESEVVVPCRPTKEGQVFAGWYRDEALQEFFDFESERPVESLTLYAKWLQNTMNEVDITPFNNKFSNTYHIKTAAQLRGLAAITNGIYDANGTMTKSPDGLEGKTVVLDNDIFLNDTTDWRYWGHNGYAVPWTPISSSISDEYRAANFKGTFDGQGHIIYGMYTEAGAVQKKDQCFGLFQVIEGAIIKNVGIRASVIDLQIHDNLFYYQNQGVGGSSAMLVQWVAGENNKIENCFTEGRIVCPTNEMSETSGLIAHIYGSTTISNCYSRVDVEDIDADDSDYGLVAGIDGWTNPTVNATNCYSAGHTANGLGITGTGLYYDKQLVRKSTLAGGRSTNEMKAKSTYDGWDFETVWGRNNDINDGYPYLRQFYADAPTDDPDPVKVTGIVLEEEGQTIEMFAGEPFQLHAHVVPEEAVSKGIIWSAQMVNNGIYYDANNAVNEDGVVNLPFEDSGSWYNNIHSRYYKITATSAEGDFKASCNVNVTYPYLTISIPEKRATANSEWVPVTRNERWTLTTEWQYKVVAETNYEGAFSPVTWGLDLDGVATIEVLSQDDMYDGKRVVTAVLTPKADADNLTIAATSEKGLKANKGYMIKYVAPQPVTVTAKSYSRVYGDENPSFEYTAEGAALDGEPEIICEATAHSPVGEYPIIIRKGSVKNSNDSYVNGVLTITKAPLTITAASYTKKQYDPMPEFSVSYKGFKNNETEEVLTKQPVLSCEANEDSEPGVYDVVVSGAEAQNYEMKYVVGKLTVTEPDSYTLTYMVDGEEYKSFTVKYRESITPLEAPEKEGYTFSGWDGLPISMPAKDVVVKGSFTINSYTIAYVLDGEVYTIETLEYGAEIVPPVIPGLEEYTIWEDVPATMPAKDITIYGKAKDIIDSLTPTLYSGKGEVFDLKGRKLSAPQKGLNIIRMSDGTIRKVIYTPQGQAVK